MTCGCVNGVPGVEKTPLWKDLSVADKDWFDFQTAWQLGSRWCEIHGNEFCERLLTLD